MPEIIIIPPGIQRDDFFGPSSELDRFRELTAKHNRSFTVDFIEQIEESQRSFQSAIDEAIRNYSEDDFTSESEL